MKNKILSAIMAAVIGFGSLAAPEYLANSEGYFSADAAVTVSSPVASKKTATYTLSGSSMKVTLSCSTNNASIYYSLNGASYKKYTGAISITKNSTLKTYAKIGTAKSAVTTYRYMLLPKVSFSPTAGTYTAAKTVKLSTPVSGVKFYYTLDGTAPTKSSSVYTSAGIKITKSSTLRVLAVKTGWNSYNLTRKYVINKSSSGTRSPGNSTASGSILGNYTSKWAYSTLNSTQKKGYQRLFEAVSKNKSSVDVSDLGLYPEDINDMFWAFHYDNPQFLTLGNSVGYSISSSKGTVIELYGMYARDSGDINQSKFNSVTASLIAKAKTLKTDYDRLKYFHDWIINNTRYTNPGPEYISKADGPILYGKALCEGYSRAYEYLCQSVGIPCVCVKSSNHMWNMVKLNGVWYNVDVTFDDPVMSDGSDALRYTYFLKSTATIQRTDSDHSFKNPFKVPSATKDY